MASEASGAPSGQAAADVVQTEHTHGGAEMRRTGTGPGKTPRRAGSHLIYARQAETSAASITGDQLQGANRVSLASVRLAAVFSCASHGGLMGVMRSSPLPGNVKLQKKYESSSPQRLTQNPKPRD